MKELKTIEWGAVDCHPLPQYIFVFSRTVKPRISGIGARAPLQRYLQQLIIYRCHINIKVERKKKFTGQFLSFWNGV